MCIPSLGPYRTKILEELHSSKIGGHFGFNKTYQRIKNHYYWASLRRDIFEYIKNCESCIKNKYERHKIGKLSPWPIPHSPWEDISMDFILGFPMTLKKNNSCLVIVDRFSKQAHFIPTRNTVTASQTADLFIREIFKHHGLPKSILSDRDTKFTSLFWEELTKALGISLHMGTAYHSSADGQSEVMNRILEDYLRHFVSYTGKDWESLLPFAEFSYNSSISSSTGFSPHEIIYGRELTLPGLPLQQISHVSVAEFVADFHAIIKEARQKLQVTQEQYQRKFDKYRTDRNFKEGELVFVKLQFGRYKTLEDGRATEKLARRYYGPFPIKKKHTAVSYELDLQQQTKIHPIFHISLLKPATQNSLTPTSIPNDPETSYLEPESILDVDYHTLRDGKSRTTYLIKWKGLGEKHATWEDIRALKNNPLLYHQLLHIEDNVPKVGESYNHET